MRYAVPFVQYIPIKPVKHGLKVPQQWRGQIQEEDVDTGDV